MVCNRLSACGFDETKFSCLLFHRHSTAISLETRPFIRFMWQYVVCSPLHKKQYLI